MTARSFYRRAAVLLACAIPILGFLACVSPIPAAAQEQSPFSISVHVGYEGSYRIGEWFPVFVEVANNGPDALATVEWNFPSGQLEEQVFREQVALPQGSQKRVTMNVFLTSFAHIGQVRLLNGETVLASQDITLDAVDESVFLSLVVSSDAAMLNSLQALKIPEYKDSRVRHIPLQELPDHIASLRGINAIFIHDTDTTALTPAQRDALSVWVGSGGQLVVSGGIGGQRTAAGISDLLPVQVTNNVAQGSLAELSTGTGTTSAPLNTEVTLSEVQPRATATTVPSNTQLLYEWQYGSGRATFSRFDFGSLRAWADEPAFWGQVLIAPTSLASAAAARLSRINIFDRNVLELPSLNLPSTSTLLVFLLGYIIVIGPLNYIVLRRLRRLEWAWLTVPLIVLVFAGGLYTVGNTLRGGQAQFSQASIVLGVEGQPRAAATAFIGLFSPQRATYTVSFSGDTLVNNAEGRASLSNRFDTVLTNEAGRREVTILSDVASFNTFITHTVVDLPVNVQTSLISDTTGLTGEVRNLGQSALDDVMLIRGNTFAQLGRLEPGATGQVSGQLQGNFPRAVGLSKVDVFNRQEMLNLLFDRDFVRLSNPNVPSNAGTDDGVYLLAWASRPILTPDVNGQPSTQNGLTLYVLRLPTAQ